MDPRTIPVAFGDQANGQGRAPSANGGEPTQAVAARTFHTSSIDIYEVADGLVLEADLPGATDDSVTFQLEDNVLVLHARVASPAPEGARTLHEDYQPFDFQRSFILSDEVERAKISAELKNGVLRLRLPKAERAKTRRIEIKS